MAKKLKKIEAKEFRLYNLVKCRVSNDAAIYQIIAIKGVHLMLGGVRDGTWYHQDKIKPIPITDEWMKKFNFKESNWTDGGRPIGKWWDYEDNNFPLLTEELQIDGHSTSPVEYIHQLQNLYFALTGEELNYGEV